MAYSSAQRSFEANGCIAPPSPDLQTNIALNLSKGLSELTASLAIDIQNLRSQLTDLRHELEDLKAERRRLII
jgi:hypothetical protein